MDPWRLCAGDGASLTPGIGPNICNRVSSSDGVLISTSLSNDDKNEGGALPAPAALLDAELPCCCGCCTCCSTCCCCWICCCCRLDEPGSRAADEDDSPFVSGNRLVRGRFNFLSGSWCGSSSFGSAVAERDLRFRESISLAFSKAPQASRSSRVGGLGWGRSTHRAMLFKKTSLAPKRAAMFRRCCQRSCSSRSRSRSWRDRWRPSNTAESSSSW